MNNIKKILAILLCLAMICVSFAGCSSNKEEKYSDTTLIIGYTKDSGVFLEVDENGKATGFFAELWEAIFDSVKGELKNYVFEQVDEGYKLEEDGGFFDSTGKEYSAGLLMGAVTKNNGTFNEDYSFTEPIITDRIIAVTANNSKVKDFGNFKKAKAVVVGEQAKEAFHNHSAISGVCKSITYKDKIGDALTLLDKGKADVVIVNELSFLTYENAASYSVLDGNLDAVEYVIATAKYSGWKNSINEAIRELKDEKYNGVDGFTPMVEKYFGYNASSFDYKTEGDE